MATNSDIIAGVGQEGGCCLDPKDVWLVIAAYNEDKAVGAVLDSIAPCGYRVAVVDDASTDATYKEVAERRWVHRLRHPINLGQGASLQTGITYALAARARYVVTFDADGQHTVADVARLIAPLVSGEADVCLGSRFLTASDACLVPRNKRLLLRAATLYARAITGMRLSDVHNGLRAFTAAAAAKLAIRQNRMSHASEILRQIHRQGLRYREVPVTITYSAYSVMKGQKMRNAFNIVWDSIEDFIKG